VGKTHVPSGGKSRNGNNAAVNNDGTTGSAPALLADELSGIPQNLRRPIPETGGGAYASRYRSQISDEAKAIAAEREAANPQDPKPPAASPIPVPASPGDGAAAGFNFASFIADEGQEAMPAKASNGTSYTDKLIEAAKQESKRMSDNTQTTALARVTPADDGFAGYVTTVEGADQQSFSGVIQGTLMKFGNDAKWYTRDTIAIDPAKEFLAVGVSRVVQKWLHSMPVETITLAPGQPSPDVERMNAETPQSEWEMGPDGKPRGPWQAQQIVYMLDAATMDKYSFPTGTIGGSKAIKELVDKINWIRGCKGAGFYPVITLADTHMPTRFGGRQRPHFIVKRWEKIGGTPAAAISTTVAPPTLKEDLKDEIPF
jgi:hypothetical protein